MRVKRILLNLIFAAAALCGASNYLSAQKGLGAVVKLAAEEGRTLRTFENASAKTFTLVNSLNKVSSITKELNAPGLAKSSEAEGFNRRAVVNAPVNPASKIEAEKYKDQLIIQATFKAYLVKNGKIIDDNYGTASLMFYKDRLIIVTADHIADQGENFVLENYRGEQTAALSYAPFNGKPDIGIFEIPDIANNNFLRGINPIPVAKTMPREGGNLRFFGYSDEGPAARKRNGGFKIASTSMSVCGLEISVPGLPKERIEMSGAAQPGNSGSALVKENNEAAGVVYGGNYDDDITVAVHLRYLKKALDFYINNPGTYTYIEFVYGGKTFKQKIYDYEKIVSVQELKNGHWKEYYTPRSNAGDIIKELAAKNNKAIMIKIKGPFKEIPVGFYR